MSAANAAVDAALGRAEVRARLAEQEMEPAGGPPEAAAAFYAAEQARWTATLRAVGVAPG